jgi:hypothetical protein
LRLAFFGARRLERFFIVSSLNAAWNLTRRLACFQ